MPPYEKHVLVCTSCEGCPGFQLLKALRQELKRQGAPPHIRIQGADCLDACDFEDTVMVVYPEGAWYGKVALEDVEEIVQGHLLGGRRVERKLIDFPARTVGGVPLAPGSSGCATSQESDGTPTSST